MKHKTDTERKHIYLTCMRWLLPLLLASAILVVIFFNAHQQETNDRLIIAIKNGDRAAVNTLLKVGADPNTFETEIPVPLWKRAIGGRLPAGKCCVLIAAEHDPCDADIIKLLLMYGANRVDVFDKNGTSAALLAFQHGSNDATWELLQYGALKSSEIDRELLLGEASDCGDIRIVRKLLELKTDVDAKACRHDKTPLIRATENGQIDLVKLLLKNGAGVDRAMTDGHTALMSAVSADRIDLVELFLKYGADVNRAGRWDAPLTNAIEGGDLKLVRLLVDAGADTKYEGYQDSVEKALKQADNQEITTYIHSHTHN